MTARSIGAATLLATLALGCPRASPVTTAPVIAAPKAAPLAAEPPPGSSATRSAPSADCVDALPPADMLEGNIAATSMTGLAEIVRSSKTGADGKSPAPTSGYVTFRYEVRVLEWFAGAGPERIVLTQTAEAGFDPKPRGELLFFSACAASGESAHAYEPDVGYFFPVDPACRAEATALGSAVATRARGRVGAAAESACSE